MPFCVLEPVKADVPELENLGFVEDVSGSVYSLLSVPSKEIKCVESIVFSSFNPPPSYRRFLLIILLIMIQLIFLSGRLILTFLPWFLLNPGSPGT